MSAHSDDFWQIPAQMIRLAKCRAVPTSEDMNALGAYLDLRCAHFAETDADGALRQSEEPGYLEKPFKERRVFVPFHLGPFFPKASLFEEVVSWAERVAVEADNPICISGSTTFLDILDEIGDLDFCEYHLQEAERLPSLVAAKADDCEDISLIEVKCDTKHHFPWDSLRTWAQGATTAFAVQAPIKLDFVSHGALGVLPTTSLILALGDDPEEGAAKHSFAYQEAVLARKTPPRTLLRPESLADYLLWLIEDAKKWLNEESRAAPSKRGPKALKRLLSAAMLLGETALVDEVVQGLALPAIRDVTIRAKVDELQEMLERLPQSRAARYNDAVHDMVSHIALKPAEVDEVMQELLGLGRDILADLEMLLSMENAQ